MGVPDEIKSEGIQIVDLIPQKPPMVMIDKLVYSDDIRAETKFYIKKDNIFCKDGLFREPGLIENIAQTAASQQGSLFKNGKSETKIGYIGAIKNLKINFLPKINTEIYTEIIITNDILGVTVINGKVKYDDKIAAECEMKIFIGNIS